MLRDNHTTRRNAVGTVSPGHAWEGTKKGWWCQTICFRTHLRRQVNGCTRQRTCTDTQVRRTPTFTQEGRSNAHTYPLANAHEPVVHGEGDAVWFGEVGAPLRRCWHKEARVGREQVLVHAFLRVA